MRRGNCCEVCGAAFVYNDDGFTQTHCKKHRKLRGIPARGYYVVITFIDGLSIDQEDFLARMIDRKLTKCALEDFVLSNSLEGAVIQHRPSGDFYKVADRTLIKINCNGGKMTGKLYDEHRG